MSHIVPCCKLFKERGVATSAWQNSIGTKTSVIYTLKNLFSAVLAAGILVTGISLSLAIHSNRYWPHIPGFLLSTLCPNCSPP